MTKRLVPKHKAESREACMVTLVEDPDTPESGACSAFPVGTGKSQSRAFAAVKSRIVLNLVFPGETPGRESSGTLFA